MRPLPSFQELREAAWAARARGWLMAVAVAVVAMAIRASLQPLIGDALPFVLAFPATALVALRWGCGPAMLTALLCGAWVASPLLPPRLASVEMPLQLATFGTAAIITSLLCSQFYRTGGQPVAAGDRDYPETPLTRWLRAMVWGAALIPALLFASIGWWGYQKAFSDAHEEVLRADATALGHAERTFEMAAIVAGSVRDAVQGSDAALRAREAEIHRRLVDTAVALPAIAAISVWDAQGREIASSRVYPVSRTESIADRSYFRQLRVADRGLMVSERLQGRESEQEFFSAALRRSLPDGSFAGVVVVSLRAEYFQDFYQSIASEKGGLATFVLFKSDGSLLTRWPAPPTATDRLPAHSEVLPLVRAGAPQGLLFIRSSFDGVRRLVSFRRIDEQPIYVAAALGESAILAGWLRFVAQVAAVLVPTTCGLVFVSWVALKKTRREQAMLADLREEHRRRSQAELALVQAQKLETLSQLTGGVAHDFNNLLAVISNNLHVHKRLHPEVSEGKQLAAISRALKSGVRLTRQLLSFSRKQALKPETIVLQQWLPAAGDLIRTTVGRGIELQIEVAPGTAPVHVDATELELALLNVAVNARQAMPEGGRLRIRAEDAMPLTEGGEPMVAIRATDTGSGIPPEIIGRVFDAFFTTKEAGQGSGLGLSQVHGLCVQAGGTATITSTVGQGTTVSMLLPAAGSMPAFLPTVPSTQLAQLHGRVLLVEDNDEVAAGIVPVMQSAGLTVRVAADADAGLAMFLHGGEPFDLVLSDIAMPGSMDGIQLARRLQQLSPRLPVLLMTGYSARIHEATEAGLRVLSKPTDPLELLVELERALARARSAPAEAANQPEVS